MFTSPMPSATSNVKALPEAAQIISRSYVREGHMMPSITMIQMHGSSHAVAITPFSLIWGGLPPPSPFPQRFYTTSGSPYLQSSSQSTTKSFIYSRDAVQYSPGLYPYFSLRYQYRHSSRRSMARHKERVLRSCKRCGQFCLLMELI